jgi:hypothetical protein
MMDFDFNSDQVLLADVLEKWSAGHREIPADERLQPFIDGEELADELHGQGFFEVCATPELGVLGAVLLIEAAGRTPFAIEVGGSALVAPALGLADLPRPLAMLKAGGRPAARFLRSGGCALVDCGDHVSLLACGDRVEALKSASAYPVGRYDGDFVADAHPLGDVPVAALRRFRTIAVAAEALAAMESTLALTLEHVASRVQFGRPIGSFQALQHRLGECSAIVSAVRWLLYRGAADDTAEGERHAGETAIVAHDAAKRVIYETTQFHGALGLTLEYPLHLWTYRLRTLQTELSEAAAAASR